MLFATAIARPPTYAISASLASFNCAPRTPALTVITGCASTEASKYVGNFFFMAVIATLAADKAQAQDVEGGQKLMKSSYPIRILLLAGLLVVCAWSGYFDILALALPLLFVRPIIMVCEFFGKKGA